MRPTWISGVTAGCTCLCTGSSVTVEIRQPGNCQFQLGTRIRDCQWISKQETVVIQNGIDTELFFPDPVSGRQVRAGWGVEDNEVLIGLIGRIDPMKDHSTFLKAAKTVGGEHERNKFVCVGTGAGEYAREMTELRKPSASPIG